MTKKQQRYNFIAHAIKHGFSYREIGKMLGIRFSYVHEIYHSKPVPKLKGKSLCLKCTEMLADLTKLDK